MLLAIYKRNNKFNCTKVAQRTDVAANENEFTNSHERYVTLSHYLHQPDLIDKLVRRKSLKSQTILSYSL